MINEGRSVYNAMFAYSKGKQVQIRAHEIDKLQQVVDQLHEKVNLVRKRGDTEGSISVKMSDKRCLTENKHSWQMSMYVDLIGGVNEAFVSG